MDESEWDAIFINHSLEMQIPTKSVQTFIHNSKNKEKLVVFGISQDAELAIKSVDAISGASVLKQVSNKSDEIIARLHRIMNLQGRVQFQK